LGYTFLYCLGGDDVMDFCRDKEVNDFASSVFAITDARHPRNVRIREKKIAWLQGGSVADQGSSVADQGGSVADQGDQVGLAAFLRFCHSLRINEIPDYERLLKFPDGDFIR